MLRVIVALTILLTVTVVAQSPSVHRSAASATLDLRQSGPGDDAPAVTIRGRVASADGNVPLRRARVLLAAGFNLTDPVFTGADGRFRLTIRRADTLTVSVSKGGFAVATARIERPDGEVALQVRLRPAAVIAGRVIDASGAPVVGQGVHARRADLAQGPIAADSATLLELATGQSRIFFGTTTDDRGEYRLSGLPAGAYQVSSLAPAIIPSATENGIAVRAGGDPPRPTQTEIKALVTVGAGQEARADLTLIGRVNQRGLTRRVFSIGATGRVVAPSDAADLRAIEGTIVDEYGEPLQDVRVQAVFLWRRGGRFAGTRLGDARTTDDRGRYRIFGLPPGRYLVMAVAGGGVLRAGTAASISPPDARATPLEFIPVYHPGAPQSAQASVVTLERADAAGISFTLAPSLAVRMTGIALDSAGNPLSGAVRAVPAAGGTSVALESASTRTDAAGAFVLPPVPPGTYVLEATTTRDFRGAFEAGTAIVTVAERDPPPVTIRTSRGVRLEGRLAGDGDPDPLWCVSFLPEPPQTCTQFAAGSFSLAAVPADPGGLPESGGGDVPIVLGSGGPFYANGLRGRMAIALRRAPEGWFLKSVTIDGTDMTDGSFDFSAVDGTIGRAEVVVSRNGASVAGRVLDDRGAPVSGGSVAVFPTSRDQWTPYSRRTRTASTGTDGSFVIRGLPPGAYYVARLDGVDVAVDEWQGADILGPLLAGAREIALAEGETRTVEVR